MKGIPAASFAALLGAALLLGGCNRQDPYVRAANQPTPAERTGGTRNVPDWVNGIPNMKVAEHPQAKRK